LKQQNQSLECEVNNLVEQGKFERGQMNKDQEDLHREFQDKIYQMGMGHS